MEAFPNVSEHSDQHTNIEIEDQMDNLQFDAPDVPRQSEEEIAKIVNPQILQHVKTHDSVVFAMKVYKYNNYKWKQERLLVVTKSTLLIFKQSLELRRNLSIKKLSGISINKKQTQEMVLHVNQEPDIRISLKNRKMLIDILKVQYLEVQKNKSTNLPIYGVSLSNLSVHEKTDKDIKKGIESKEPDYMLRLEEEDLVKINLDQTIVGLDDEDQMDSDLDSQTEEEGKTNVENIDIKEMGDAIEQFHNQKSIQTTIGATSTVWKSSKSILDQSLIDERNTNKEINRKINRKKSSHDSEDEETIFRDLRSVAGNPQYDRKSDPIFISKNDRKSSSGGSGSSDSVGLEDFKVISFINKGTFGTVFLAYLQAQESYFAIKCISKDLLLQKDLIEKVKLEKLIMLSVDHPFIVQMHYVYQKNYRIYFVMDYIKGGELFKHIK
jgi:hypothetical protein